VTKTKIRRESLIYNSKNDSKCFFQSLFDYLTIYLAYNLILFLFRDSYQGQKLLSSSGNTNNSSDYNNNYYYTSSPSNNRKFSDTSTDSGYHQNSQQHNHRTRTITNSSVEETSSVFEKKSGGASSTTSTTISSSPSGGINLRNYRSTSPYMPKDKDSGFSQQNHDTSDDSGNSLGVPKLPQRRNSSTVSMSDTASRLTIDSDSVSRRKLSFAGTFADAGLNGLGPSMNSPRFLKENNDNLISSKMNHLTVNNSNESERKSRNRANEDIVNNTNTSSVFGDLQLQLSHNEEEQQLIVKVIKARNLIAKDSNGFSDPYVKVYLLPGRE
jgi:hypothetical protein